MANLILGFAFVLTTLAGANVFFAFTGGDIVNAVAAIICAVSSSVCIMASAFIRRVSP